ncbi:elongation factor Tu-like [Planococcus citri]|uniref:elongation factor Tu-like n=1 Tax=Planococcus citri TaxID=170843 RepID=UPI0031F7D992
MTGTFFRLLYSRSCSIASTKAYQNTYARYVFNYKLFKCNYSTVDSLPNCNVGTIGHIDHGKTTLTAAITRYAAKKGGAKYVSYDQIDQAPQEKARGITINICHVGYKTDKRRYSHTDCPGHADFVKNMISGTTQMDGVIVVVAATDGEMPQTREHLLLAKQIGVKKLVVFINKADLVDKDVLELVEMEMRDLIASYGFNESETPVIIGSALLALEEDTSPFGEPAIQQLLDALDTHFEVPVRDVTSPFYMPIDNFLPVSGRGTVIVGTIKQGKIQKKTPGVIMGFDVERKTAVNDIQVFHQSVNEAVAGDNVGLLVKGVKTGDVQRGQVFCAERSFKLANFCEAHLYLLSENEGGRARPIAAKYLQMAYSETWTSYCRIDLPKEIDMLMPGEHATVTVLFLFKMPFLVGQKFTIRENNKQTVASGVITRVIGATPKLKGPNMATMTLPEFKVAPKFKSSN